MKYTYDKAILEGIVSHLTYLLNSGTVWPKKFTNKMERLLGICKRSLKYGGSSRRARNLYAPIQTELGYLLYAQYILSFVRASGDAYGGKQWLCKSRMATLTLETMAGGGFISLEIHGKNKMIADSFDERMSRSIVGGFSSSNVEEGRITDTIINVVKGVGGFGGIDT